MQRKITLVFVVLIVSLLLVASVQAAAPNFGPALYADGEVFATTGLTALPAPNSNNVQSFDKLFVITNGAEGQMPVAEAAPGNPAFNGGRWATQTVSWTDAGFAAHGDVPVLTSYAEIMVHYNLGHLEIIAGSPAGGPPDFFLCPLLPVH